MVSNVLKAEGILRVLAMVMAALAALLVGLDTQTKTIFFLERKATAKDLTPLWVLTVISSVAAGYQLLQICRCFAVARLEKYPYGSNKFMPWACFLLDQGATYATFAGATAATQGSAVAVLGVGNLQWGKLCNIYTKFCEQAAGGLMCGFVASMAMAVVSSISAHHLFRHYPSPDRQSATSRSRRWALL